jgi:16S rRNA (guanine527-N7)-methyltransferase
VNPSLDTLPPPVPTGAPAAADAIHESREWHGLAIEAERIGVPLDEQMLARFAAFQALLLDRNAHFNLTAVAAPDEVERRLFFDALAMIPAIDVFLRSDAQRRSRFVRLIDIGSGAGFPGIALKIVRPELIVVLVDSTAKKVVFQRDVFASLNLPGIEAIHVRAEELGRDARYRESFQLATARAVASLPTLLELVTPFLEVGGEALLPKGLQLDDELRAGRRAARQLGCRLVDAKPMPGGTSRLVRILKTTLTPHTYPRRIGLPNRLPLGGGG